MSRGGLGLFRPVAIAVVVGLIAFVVAGKLFHLSTRVGSFSHYQRVPIGGPQADSHILNTIASTIAKRPVTVTCRDGLFDEGHSGEVVMGSDTATLDTNVCVDLGHFAAEPASELACAESNPHKLCPGTINQVLSAMATLAHESVHLFGEADEATADCYSRQYVAQVAESFGSSRDQAHKLLHYFNDHFDQIKQPSSEYISSECRPGGSLDLRPNSPSWPD